MFTVKVRCRHPKFGLELSTDELFQPVLIFEVARSNKCSVITIASPHKAVVIHLKGAHIVAINDDAIFSKGNTLQALAELHIAKAIKFTLTVGYLDKTTAT